jgi:hypothetical protein
MRPPNDRLTRRNLTTIVISSAIGSAAFVLHVDRCGVHGGPGVDPAASNSST